jgi:hypothetical protein
MLFSLSLFDPPNPFEYRARGRREGRQGDSEIRMGFFNSLSIRIPLAIIGGIFYSALTYSMITLLDLSSELAIPVAFIVFFFYLASRLLLLFSGIHTRYYSKGDENPSLDFHENIFFYQTAQWVGKLYDTHDRVLFVFLALLSIAFLVTLVADLAGHKPLGDTLSSLFLPLSSVILQFFH